MRYKDAVALMAKAKNGVDRPLDGGKNRRILWYGGADENGQRSIALRLYWTDVVILHPDDTITIDTNGYGTPTTLKFLRQYANVRIVSQKGQWYISDQNDGVTPPKIQKCRRCSGSGIQRGWSYGEYGPAEPGKSAWSNYVHYDQPKQTFSKCWGCDGVGRRDYGSKPIYTMWHGQPVRIDADGNLLGSEPIPGVNITESKAKGFWKQPANAHNVGATLRELLPGLRTRVPCPVDVGLDIQCAGTASIDELVIHLNDFHKWPREEIADWLDTLDADLRFPTAA